MIKRKKQINAGWAFKDELSGYPEKRRKKKKTRNKNARIVDFYKSPEWLELRYKAIKKYGRKCMCCNRTVKDHGIVIHVDHVKPKSKFPNLALDINNLQILCEDCNLGKSNLYCDDYR